MANRGAAAPNPGFRVGSQRGALVLSLILLAAGMVLLAEFEGRILNVHLGLSPYYRGSGTNFWALVNGEPEYVGATFMHMDAGVDTGLIIHQIRARVYPGDSPHQVGNRLIADMAATYITVIRNFDRLELPSQPPAPQTVRCYRKRDFTPASVKALYRNFDGGVIGDYLSQKKDRDRRVPLVSNPTVCEASLPP